MSASSSVNGLSARYGLPFLAHAILLTPLITFIPAFYSEDFRLPLATVGLVLFFTRLSLVAVEPLIGVLSDRTRTRFGRRKPWIVAGLPLLMLGTFMVFAPPVKVTAGYAAFWIALTLIALLLVDTPYRAWGGELSKNYAGRTRVVAWREGFGTGSSLLALVLIFVFQRTGHGDNKTILFWMGTIAACSMPLLFAFTLSTVPEPAPETFDVQRITAREAVGVVLGNKPFLWLVGGLVVFLTGAMIGASLHLIVIDKVFHARNLFPIMLIGENLANLASYPFWMWLSRRIGKHRALALGAAGMGLLSLPIPLIDHRAAGLYAACIVIRGFAGGALGILVVSMIADVVDLDTLKTGKARQGLYFALVGALSNLGGALGALVGTALPAAFGFATVGAANTASAEFALMATYAWIPALIMGGAAPFFWLYPLTESVQRDLRAQIVDRLQRHDATLLEMTP